MLKVDRSETHTTLELNYQLNHVLSCTEIFHFIIFHFHQHHL